MLLGGSRRRGGIGGILSGGGVALGLLGVAMAAVEQYMDTLARRLGLDKAAVDEIHDQLGVERE